MNGLTCKQIETRMKVIYGCIRNHTITAEQERELKELQCRSMINSCIIYGETYNFYDKTEDAFTGQYATDYVKSFGEETVRRLWNEQKETMSKATIRWGVYTDDEGVSYNSVEWPDEN